MLSITMSGSSVLNAGSRAHPEGLYEDTTSLNIPHQAPRQLILLSVRVRIVITKLRARTISPNTFPLPTIQMKKRRTNVELMVVNTRQIQRHPSIST